MAETTKNTLENTSFSTEAYKFAPELYQRYDVKRGLRNLDGSGVLAGLTNVSEVHGYIVYEGEKKADYGSLSYRGYDIFDLAKHCGLNGRFAFEEAVFLLLYGHLPKKEEFEEFLDVMSNLRELPEYFTEDMILKAPSKDIMNKLSRSVLTLYSYDENADNTSPKNVLRQSISLISKLPVLAAYGYWAKAHYFDKRSLILHQPQKEYSIAENILHMIRENSQFTEEEAKILDLALLLHAEHGGGNNSAFTCRVLTSSGTDTYSAISGAINALKGPKHGGANIQVVRMMRNIEKHVENLNDEEEIFNYLAKIIKREAFDRSGLIYGMGHAVYTKSDPRGEILRQYAMDLAYKTGNEEKFKLYQTVEKLTPLVFAKYKDDKKVISANIDFYSGFVYGMLNIPSDLYTPLFAIARIAGWSAHRMEEIISGGRILRPAYKSICKNEREFVEMKDR
ncbi:MAG: citrate/2-methylcitrate synthase [Ruminococcaceae bacterium]|nr:citrate/2-methylcitrate synthase [Oscillospiraceae bacterium]